MDELKRLPFWNKLSEVQRTLLESSVREHTYEKGSILHRGSLDCVGLFLVLSGQLRVYTISEEGRELTLYRLFAEEMCLFSASCIIRGLQFDAMVSAVEHTRVLHIPSPVYGALMEEALPVASYTSELMAMHFSEIMWRMDQILNKKLDVRLAALLLEEARLGHSDTLSITHEQLANHLGSAREVVTRMLKHFQKEGVLRVGRGSIELLDMATLRDLAADAMR